MDGENDRWKGKVKITSVVRINVAQRKVFLNLYAIPFKWYFYIFKFSMRVIDKTYYDRFYF